MLCDLADKGLDCLNFLRSARQAGMVRAVALCSELCPELHRTLEHMGSFSGLQMLGVLGEPVHMRNLHRVLQCYSMRNSSATLRLPAVGLPSEEEVRRGLALGEFRAWFQPKRCMASGAVAGAEALVRWENPARGVMLPKDFLAAVLAYDLIDHLFKQLLEQGLSLLGVLGRQGFQIELAFNLHASQLVDGELVGHIQRRLERWGMSGASVLFEVTENGLLELSARTLENLLHLRLLGCGLSIDDFGVGFSSLNMLCQLPLTQIKLDGEFVQDLGDARNCAMVSSTLALCRSLNLQLVIEGVSSEPIRDGLVAMGCCVGQGFYLARPMTGDGLLAWLEALDQQP